MDHSFSNHSFHFSFGFTGKSFLPLTVFGLHQLQLLLYFYWLGIKNEKILHDPQK